MIISARFFAALFGVLMYLFPAGWAVAAVEPKGALEPLDHAVCRLIESAARENRLPVAFLTRIVWRESSFRAGVVSPAGAEGITQFMPQTAHEGGLAATVDVLPSPWLLVRVEYMHRGANIPLFSGQQGITGPDGVIPKDDVTAATFRPDLRRFDDRAILALILRL
jgi:hypothetical protein